MVRLNVLTVIAAAAVLASGCSQAPQTKQALPQTGTAPTSETSPSAPAGDKEAASGVYEGTVTGVISDSMCGLDHSAAIKGGHMGKDAVDCTLKCVEGGSRFVLADKANNLVYDLSDQESVKQFAGKPVKIEGHIDKANTSIHVHSVTAE